MQCTARQLLSALLDNVVRAALPEVKCESCDSSDNVDSRDRFDDSSGREETLFCTTRTNLPD